MLARQLVLKHVQPQDCEPFFNAALTTQVIIQSFLYT